MTRKYIPWILWLPLLLWSLMALWVLAGSWWVQSKAYPVHGVVWKDAQHSAVVHLTEEKSASQVIYRLQVVAPPDQRLWVGRFPVEQHFLRTGLVCALQADLDPELEIIVWDAAVNPVSFILDWNQGQVRQLPISHALPAAQAFMAQWRWYHVTARGYILLSLYLLPIWYGALGLAAWWRQFLRPKI